MKGIRQAGAERTKSIATYVRASTYVDDRWARVTFVGSARNSKEARVHNGPRRNFENRSQKLPKPQSFTIASYKHVS